MSRSTRLALLAVGVGAAAWGVWEHRAGIDVTVVNASRSTLQQVNVLLRDRSYELGSIPPGGSARVKVRPAGESDLTIKYTDHEPREYWLDCYIEPYDRGSSRFAVYSDGRVDADILIRGLPGWLGVFGE